MNSGWWRPCFLFFHSHDMVFLLHHLGGCFLVNFVDPGPNKNGSFGAFARRKMWIVWVYPGFLMPGVFRFKAPSTQNVLCILWSNFTDSPPWKTLKKRKLPNGVRSCHCHYNLSRSMIHVCSLVKEIPPTKHLRTFPVHSIIFRAFRPIKDVWCWSRRRNNRCGQEPSG